MITYLQYLFLIVLLGGVSSSSIEGIHARDSIDDNVVLDTRDTTSDDDPDEPRTPDVLHHVVNNMNVNIQWTNHSSGQYADIEADVWHPAVTAVHAKNKAKRELAERKARSKRQPAGPAPQSSTLQPRGLLSDTTIPGGINTHKTEGDKGYPAHNFFSCYNSGEIGFDATINWFAVAGCGVISAFVLNGTRVWISHEFADPDHGRAKLYMTLTRWGLVLFGTPGCVFIATWTTTYACQKVKDSYQATQGGKFEWYANPTSSLTNGDKLAELRIDPNKCGGNVFCDQPATNDVGQVTPPAKDGSTQPP